ncbi:MAG: MFS transporter [Dehalococcoidia bacterium]|nr:MFS transporter [Dehalococcoidia bacterium]
MPGITSRRTFAALAYRDYRLMLAGSTLVGMVQPLQFMTQVFWVQDQYPERDVFYVGLVAASRGCAMLLFSLLGGAFADRFERRRVLLWCEGAAFGLNALIALLMLTNPFGEWTMVALVTLTFLAAGNMAIDMPARSAAIPAIVGMDTLGSAISLNMIAMQLSFPVMLPLVGVLNDAFDPGHVYAGSLVVFLAVIPMIAMLRFRDVGRANRDAGMLGNIREGLQYARRDRAIFGILAMVIVMQVIGMPGVATLGPVWMTDVLDLSRREFGLVATTWGLGALVASLFLGFRTGWTQRGTTLCAAAIGFGLASAVFGHSRFVPLTAVANFALGACMVSTMVSASTIVQHVVKDEMRGRVMGLFPLAMGLAMLNAGPVSFASQQLGMEVVVPVMAWATVALAAAIVLTQPRLRGINPPPISAAHGPPVAQAAAD